MLTINLQDPRAAYAQGDLVAGQVIYHVGNTHPLASQPVHILIEVNGRTKTKAPGSDDRYGQGDLFWTKVAQFQGSATVWSFSFKFPARASTVDPRVVDVRGWTTQMGTIRSDHPLPPTFNDQGAPKFLAAVEYRIRASVWAKSTFGPAHMLGERSVPIVYRPRDDPQLRVPTKGEVHKIRTHRTIKSDRFVSKQKHPDRTARGRLSSFLHQFQVPSIRCQIQLTIPLKVQVGEEIPCLLTVTPLRDESTAVEIPPFTLTGFSITVTGKTKVWVPGESGTDWVKSRTDVILDKAKTDMNVGLSSQRVIISPSVQGTSPTFKTYNISRTYTICIAVDIRCADITLHASEEAGLVVLPGTGDYSSSLEEAVQGDFDVLDPSGLPSYAEATSQITQGLFSILGG
ncbi:hypothetical protein BJX61DRAFT_543382 [Aspergillus egyptiacus]|nr:hypothetical protein BJX61DRAFT_543382 [Aspergillus egyptiacus]